MKLLILVFLKTFAFVKYQTCLNNGSNYPTLDEWLEPLGIDFTKVVKTSSEKIGALNLYMFKTGEGKTCYLFNLKNNFDFLDDNLAERVVKNYLEKAKSIIPKTSPSHHFSCYLRGTRAYFLFIARGSTKRVNFEDFYQQNFSYRLAFYLKVLKYLKQKIDAGIMFSHFMLNDFFLINNDIDQMTLVALNEIVYQAGDYRDEFLKVFYDPDENEAQYYQISDKFLDRKKFSKEELVYINLLYNIEFVEKKLLKNENVLRKGNKSEFKIRAKFTNSLNELLYKKNKRLTFEKLYNFLGKFSEDLKAENDLLPLRGEIKKESILDKAEFETNKNTLPRQELYTGIQSRHRAAEKVPKPKVDILANSSQHKLEGNNSEKYEDSTKIVTQAKRIKQSKFSYLQSFVPHEHH